MSFLDDHARSHYNGDLTPKDLGREVVLFGWVDNRRDHGGCVFIDLRDRTGIVQVVFDPNLSEAAHHQAGALRSEWVVGIVGEARSRGGNVNPNLKTGTLEIAAKRLCILNAAKTPPFPIVDKLETHEETRLAYRYLDLRRPSLQHNLMRRHQFLQATRALLSERGFLEIETPFLIRSTPEGARDYVVPSRVHPNSFFALPQSPQLFKQLLMVSGYDRYFQIARCFRDEDLRAERQPEFTQVDLELSFCTAAQIQEVVEALLKKIFETVLGVHIETPFARIRYDEAMARFGSDAPDMRFGLELKTLDSGLRLSTFQVFSRTLAAGGTIKGINLRDAGELSRKDLDDLGDFAKTFGAQGLAWARIKADNTWQSPIAKFLTDEERQFVQKELGLATGDVAVFMADQKTIVNNVLNGVRRKLGKERKLYKEGTHHLVWVDEFPLFEKDHATGALTSAHHPFTSPKLDDVTRLTSDPASVRAEAYDIVLNGVEIGGGSIRIHDQAIQAAVFSALGISADEQQEKFGFLLDALAYGAPPHGGLALGVDRIMMQLCQTPSIRDVIAFPKTQKQTDLMLHAPAPLGAQQLAELAFIVKTPESKP